MIFIFKVFKHPRIVEAGLPKAPDCHSGHARTASLLVSVGLVSLLLAAAGCRHYKPYELSPACSLEQLESRSLESDGLRAFLQTNAPAILESVEHGAWNLESLTWAAIYFHPSMEVARAQWQLATASVQTAGGRPNPTVTVTPEYDFNAASGVSPWLPAVSFDVPIETAGKRNHRIAQAEQLAEAARLNMAAAAWQIRGNLRSALMTHEAARQRSQLLEQQLEIQNRLLKLLEGRVAAGAMAPIELTTTRVASTRLLADLAEARRLSSESLALVAEGVGVPLSALKNVRIQGELKPAGLAELSSPELRRSALTSRADLLASLATYAASQSALQLELAKQYPDIHLGTGYQWDQGESKWALGVTAEIPVLNRNEGPIAEAEARRTEAAARFTALQAKVLADIERASSSLAAVQEQTRLLTTVRETQQKAYESVQAALKAGAADQFELATSELELRATDLALFETNLKLRQAVAQMEDALQQPFDALQVIQKKTQGTNHLP